MTTTNRPPAYVVALLDQLEASDRETLLHAPETAVLFREFKPGEAWPASDGDFTVTAVWLKAGRWHREFAHACLARIGAAFANGCPACAEVRP